MTDLSADEAVDASPTGPEPFRHFSRLSSGLERLFEAERNQLPLWLPVGLIAGISAWFWLPDRPGWIAFLAASLALALGLAVAAGWTRWGRALSIFALAAALGCGLIWWKAERAAAPRLAREQLMVFIARIESVQALAAERTVRLVVSPLERLPREGQAALPPPSAETALPARLRVNVDEADAADTLVPGATVRIRAWLMPPAPMAAPGAYDFARTAWFQRIGGSGRALDIAMVSPPSTQGWRARIADWRQRLAAHVRARLGGDAEGGIAAALATGDQFGIPEADAEAMRRSGLAHLLSVSGLHLTAVVGAVMLLTLKLLALSPMLALRFRLVLVAAAVGALAGIAYTLLTGAEVPTVRSCIAALLVLAGIALGRDALTLRLVAVGALVVLLLWPESLPGPSFQLSFAAITAIVALHEHPRIQALLSRRDEGIVARSGRLMLGHAPHRPGRRDRPGADRPVPFPPGRPLWRCRKRHRHPAHHLRHHAARGAGPAVRPGRPRRALLVADRQGPGLPALAGPRGVRRARRRCPAAGDAARRLRPDGGGRSVDLPVADALAPARPRSGRPRRGLGAGDACARPHRHRRWPPPRPAHSKAASWRCFGRRRATISARPWPSFPPPSPNIASSSSCRPPPAARTCAPPTSTAAAAAGGSSSPARRSSSAGTQMVRACAEADIVVADRLLPRACTPRWLRADRAFLRRSGGLSIVLGDSPRVATVADQVGRHPWRQ